MNLFSQKQNLASYYIHILFNWNISKNLLSISVIKDILFVDMSAIFIIKKLLLDGIFCSNFFWNLTLIQSWVVWHRIYVTLRYKKKVLSFEYSGLNIPRFDSIYIGISIKTFFEPKVDNWWRNFTLLIIEKLLVRSKRSFDLFWSWYYRN